MLEEEIDLGKYLQVLTGHWKLIAGLAVVSGLAALVVSFLIPPAYEATASVAIVRTRSDLTFNSNFVTQIDAAGQTSQAAIQDARRSALEALVASGNVASEVIDQIGSQLDPEERNPAALLDQVKGQAVSKGDLIQITARSGSPERAALLANSWARAYEKNINTVFSESPATLSSVQAQLAKAKADYDTAQAAYTRFTGEDQIGSLQSQLELAQSTLSDTLQLQSSTQNMLLRQQVGTQQALLQQSYSSLKDYFTNRLDVESTKALLQQTYDTRNRMLRIQQDAQAMLNQIKSGGTPSASALAQILLKAEAFSSSSNVPGNLTLQFDATNAISANSETLNLDLAALVTSLDDRLKTIQADIDRLSLEVFSTQSPTRTNVSLVRALQTLSTQQSDFEQLNTQAFNSVIAANEPLSRTIENLTQAQLGLQRQIELQTAQRRELSSARDLAWDSYSTLLSKEAELQIANETASSQVRVAAEAVAPTKPISPRKGLNTILGGFLGLILGVIGAFVIEARQAKQVSTTTSA